MPNAPACPNFLERVGCAQSNTFVASETDDSYVIKCRTCGCLNIWPKKNAEGKGRYEADLKRQLLDRQKEEFYRRNKTYSLPGGR